MATDRASEATDRASEITHARHDPATCLAPGLFRSLKKGERKKQKLDVTYQYGEETLRFIGFEPLGADDLRFLQAIVAFSGPKGLLLDAEPKTDIGRQLRLFLDPRMDAAEKDALVIKESAARLLAEVGLSDGGKNIRSLKESLRRMANVTVIVSSGPREASFHLLSYALDEEDGRLLIAVNPRIAECVLGRRPYTRIEMAEVRALKSDAAALIHQRLCGWIDPGKRGRIELDALCGYVWPDTASGSTMRMRRKKVREALAELRAAGWTVTEYVEGKFEIKRPSRGT